MRTLLMMPGIQWSIVLLTLTAICATWSAIARRIRRARRARKGIENWTMDDIVDAVMD